MKSQCLFCYKEGCNLKDPTKCINFFEPESRKQRFLVWFYKKILGLNEISDNVFK